MIKGRGYIKERSQKELVRPSPRYARDESNPDYCYAQLFLNRQRQKLTEINTVDDELVKAFQRWRRCSRSSYIPTLLEDAARSEVLDALRIKPGDDVADALPAPEWPITSPRRDADQVRHDPAITFPSRFQYTSDDVERASTFLKLVVRPFAREQRRTKDHTATALPYTYPTDDRLPAMASD